MPILPEANVRLKVEADITKRSKPVRSAKAPLTRFGDVLRGTMRPYELYLWQLHCKTLPSAPGAPVRDLRPLRAPASPVSMRRATTRLTGISIRRAVPEPERPSSIASASVRPAPAAAYGLAPYAICVRLQPQLSPSLHPAPNSTGQLMNARLCLGAKFNVITRPKEVAGDI